MKSLSLFKAALTTKRRVALLWAVVLALVTLSVVAVWPSMGASRSLDEWAASMPPEVVEALGLQDFSTPAGFLNGNLYAVLLPLLFGALGISIASSLSAGDEDAGRLELLLALPVTRTAVYLNRFLATGLIVLFGTLATGLVVLVGGPAFDLELSLSGILAVTWSMFLIGLLHAAIVMTLSGIGLRAPLVVGVAGAILAGGYMLHALAPLSEDLEPLRKISPWYWAIGNDPLRDGFSAGGSAVLLGLTAVCVALGVIMVERRSIRNA